MILSQVVNSKLSDMTHKLWKWKCSSHLCYAQVSPSLHIINSISKHDAVLSSERAKKNSTGGTFALMVRRDPWISIYECEPRDVWLKSNINLPTLSPATTAVTSRARPSTSRKSLQSSSREWNKNKTSEKSVKSRTYGVISIAWRSAQFITEDFLPLECRNQYHIDLSDIYVCREEIQIRCARERLKFTV